MKTIFLSIMALSLLTACGGGGGGSKNPETPISSASSAVSPEEVSSVAPSSILSSEAISSSSASSQPTPLDSSSSSSSSSYFIEDDGIVYADQFNQSWGQFTRYEYSFPYEIQDYTDQSGDYRLYWSEKDIGGEHGKVIELRYSDKADSVAQFEVTGNKNLSEYATGTFSFDIRAVPQAITSDNDATLPIEFMFQVECFWPCTSHSNYFTINNYDDWQHIEVPVADLIKTGLDIEAVVKSLTIRPTSADIKNATFHIDNIKWTKGTVPAVPRNTTFLAQFNNVSDSSHWQMSSPNTLASIFKDVSYGLSVQMDNAVYDIDLKHDFEFPIDVQHKHVGAIVRALDPITAQGKIYLQLTDNNGNTAITPAVFLDQVPLRHSYIFSYDTANDLTRSNDFDEKKVVSITVQLRFHQSLLDIPSTTYNSFSIDEIVIESLEASSSSSTSSTFTNGIVYADNFNPEWGELTRYERDNDAQIAHYTDQQGDYLTYWTEKDIGGEHSNVIELRYSNKSAQIGQFEVTTRENLSMYETGTLSFDIQVVPQATPSADDAMLPIEMQYQVECLWPCTSQPYYFTLDTYSSWKTIQIDVADLIQSGLDIKTVYKSLVIRPVQENLQNATFHIDNIEWKEGPLPAVQRTPLFLAQFNKYDDPIDWSLIYDSQHVSTMINDVQYGMRFRTGSGVSNMDITYDFTNILNVSGRTIGATVYANDVLSQQATVSLSLIDNKGISAWTTAVPLNSVGIGKPFQFTFDIDTLLTESDDFNPSMVKSIRVQLRYVKSAVMSDSTVDSSWNIDEIFIE